MNDTAALTVPLRIYGAPNLREHWSKRAKRVKAERDTVAWYLRPKPRPALPLVVTLTRRAPRTLDTDNLAGGFKAVRDQVASWLGVDDADQRVTWVYAQDRAKHYEVIITMEKA